MTQGYAFNFQGHGVFTPNGKTGELTTQEQTDAHNKRVEQEELAWLKTAPDKVVLYARVPNGTHSHTSDCYTRIGPSTLQTHCTLNNNHVGTWLGTDVATHVYFGPRCNGGLFGWHSYKRSVDCRIYGVRYVGWFFESAGDLCRLRKAKVQK